MAGRAYLLQNSKIVFPHLIPNNTLPIMERLVNVPLNIKNIYPIDGEAESLQLSNTLRSLVDTSDDETEANTRNMSLTLKSMENKFGGGPAVGTQFRFHGQFLDELIKILGNDSVILMVNFKRYKWFQGTMVTPRPSSSEAELIFHMKPRRSYYADSVIFEDTRTTPIDYSVSIHPQTLRNHEITITLSISVYADMHDIIQSNGDIANHNDKQYIPPPQELVSFMESLLNKNFQTDMVIVSANMTSHPCHKLILTSNSPVFETMLSDEKYKERKNSFVHIKDMSEEGVKAFLGYLYHLDVTQANKDFEITMELLQASEKYAINRLQSTMKTILMSNTTFWNAPEKALRLFCFVRNMHGCQELKKEAVKVIKTFHEDLMKSDAYMEFFTTQPTAAMDLCNEMSKM